MSSVPCSSWADREYCGRRFGYVYELCQSVWILCNGRLQRQAAHPASARCAPLERWKSQATLRMTSVALVPPKPKLLESATLISFLSATLGTRLMAVSTEGLSRLSVGGAILSRM